MIRRHFSKVTEEFVQAQGVGVHVHQYRIDLKRALNRCRQEANEYRECLKVGMLGTDQGDCEEEFQSLKACAKL